MATGPLKIIKLDGKIGPTKVYFRDEQRMNLLLNDYRLYNFQNENPWSTEGLSCQNVNF